jgi:energy-coupling factor transporter ATP-binding protein EcfA2
MILHWLEVEGYRGFGEKVRLELLPDRINVLHGPNAAGKSTLLSALVRGLLDTHRAGGQEVVALRPWGTALTPRLTVEFEQDGVVYRLSKNFLDDRGARLEKKTGARFSQLAKDDQAEARVRDMLRAEEPSVGLIKPAKWGLARALWRPQNQLPLEGLAGRAFATVQEILGTQAMTDDARRLKAEVEEQYVHYWTRGGKPVTGKNTPLWKKREDEIEKVKGDIKAAGESG